MNGLIFDEQSMIDGNIFKFEERLHSHMNKYVENGAILVTYYSQKESASTVDRGLQDIDELFGKKSPLRYNKILNFPLYGFGQTNPENSDEQQIEDFNVEGECIIIPSTIEPRPLDFFVINHLKMRGIFEITNVTYDSMKVDGYHKISYRLVSTADKTISDIENNTVAVYHTDLNAIGSDVNPIIKEDDFVYRKRVQLMLNQMITSYRSMYYNSRHNCFLFKDPKSGYDIFDMCGNEFMAKYSLMNPENISNVIVLNNKLRDINIPFYYNNSIYYWLEMGAPSSLLQKFHYTMMESSAFTESSFYRWNDEVHIIQPLSTLTSKVNNIRDSETDSYFDSTQLNAFLGDRCPATSEYDKLIWKYINSRSNLTIHDVPLELGNVLFSSIRSIDTFLYTPIVIYITRQILRMN